MKPDQNETSSAQDTRKPYVPLKLVVHGHFRDVVRIPGADKFLATPPLAQQEALAIVEQGPVNIQHQTLEMLYSL